MDFLECTQRLHRISCQVGFGAGVWAFIFFVLLVAILAILVERGGR